MEEVEVYEDIKHLPQYEQDNLLTALKASPADAGKPMPKAQARRAPRKVNAARREANMQEKRMYAKQFEQAKVDEWKSWSQENDVGACWQA